jgi:primosomal protein N' (replication factor Y)
VQTFSPDHAAIQAAARHDFLSFAASELAQRKQHGYPPYARMARVIVRSRQEAAARSVIEELANHVTGEATRQAARVRLLGPAPAPVTRVNNFYRYHLQLQAAEDAAFGDVLRPAIAALPGSRYVEIAVDVDPLAML